MLWRFLFGVRVAVARVLRGIRSFLSRPQHVVAALRPQREGRRGHSGAHDRRRHRDAPELRGGRFPPALGALCVVDSERHAPHARGHGPSTSTRMCGRSVVLVLKTGSHPFCLSAVAGHD